MNKGKMIQLTKRVCNLLNITKIRDEIYENKINTYVDMNICKINYRKYNSISGAVQQRLSARYVPEIKYNKQFKINH